MPAVQIDSCVMCKKPVENVGPLVFALADSTMEGR